ncbi:hypothetical protein LCGC14_0834310, partial [marine sediment metagenome]
MKNLCVALLGFVLVAGCTSRTRIVAGPVQVAGEVRVFETPQA